MKNPQDPEHDISAADRARATYRRDLYKWREYQLAHFPGLEERFAAIDPRKPELEAILLPSGLNEHERKAFKMEELARMEYKLREGQAYDALQELRHAIQDWNLNFQFKTNYVFGQAPNTKANRFLGTLHLAKIQAANKYRRARQALVNLGLSEDDQG